MSGIIAMAVHTFPLIAGTVVSRMETVSTYTIKIAKDNIPAFSQTLSRAVMATAWLDGTKLVAKHASIPSPPVNAPKKRMKSVLSSLKTEVKKMVTMDAESPGGDCGKTSLLFPSSRRVSATRSRCLWGYIYTDPIAPYPPYSLRKSLATRNLNPLQLF